MLEDFELPVDDAHVGRLTHVPDNVVDEVLLVSLRETIPLYRVMMLISNRVWISAVFTDEDPGKLKVLLGRCAKILDSTADPNGMVFIVVRANLQVEHVLL